MFAVQPDGHFIQHQDGDHCITVTDQFLLIVSSFHMLFRVSVWWERISNEKNRLVFNVNGFLSDNLPCSNNIHGKTFAVFLNIWNIFGFKGNSRLSGFVVKVASHEFSTDQANILDNSWRHEFLSPPFFTDHCGWKRSTIDYVDFATRVRWQTRRRVGNMKFYSGIGSQESVTPLVLELKIIQYGFPVSV